MISKIKPVRRMSFLIEVVIKLIIHCHLNLKNQNFVEFLQIKTPAQNQNINFQKSARDCLPSC